MDKKYELTDEKKKLYGHTLHRIKALKDFDEIKKGDIGGWIESENNLSQSERCWVSDNGCVFGNGRVSGNGCVSGYGCVYDNGCVFGNGRVFGYGQVSGNGCVYDNGCVFDNGFVSGNGHVFGNGHVTGYTHVSGNGEISGMGFVKSKKDYLVVQGFGTEQRSTTFFRCKDDKTRVQCGCFYGTINQFRKQVKKTRDGLIAQEYLAIADLAEKHFAE